MLFVVAVDTVVAPCGPASRQEQGSRPSAEPAAAVALAAMLYLVWMMTEGPRRARIPNLQRGCITRCCRCSSARRRRRSGWNGKQAETSTVEPVVAAGAVSCVDLRDK